MHTDFRRQPLFDLKLANDSSDSLSFEPQKHCSNPSQVPSSNFQYYSFNNCQHFFKRQSSTNRSRAQQQPLTQYSYQRSENTYRSQQNSSLLHKYSSLYKQLKTIQNNQLIYLFIEQIEQNQKSRQNLAEANRKISWVQAELKLLERNLAEKRQMLSKMCFTQSKNLDLIESMDRKLRERGFLLSEHYYSKYIELQKYMSDYICSTNQAQEEFIKKISLMKSQNQNLLNQNQQLRSNIVEISKLKNILELKLNKNDALINRQADSQRQLTDVIDKLKEQNLMMKKDIEMLIENLKSYQQFQIDLNRDNREISSSLEFLRERININTSLRTDNDATKLSGNTEEVQQLKCKLEQLGRQMHQKDRQNSQLLEDYSKMCQRMESISKDNASLMNIIEQNNRYMTRLKGQLETSKKIEEEQLNRVIKRGTSKQSLTPDSLQLTNSKAKSGFITNCNSFSKATLSRHSVLSKYDQKQNDSRDL